MKEAFRNIEGAALAGPAAAADPLLFGRGGNVHAQITMRSISSTDTVSAVRS